MRKPELCEVCDKPAEYWVGAGVSFCSPECRYQWLEANRPADYVAEVISWDDPSIGSGEGDVAGQRSLIWVSPKPTIDDIIDWMDANECGLYGLEREGDQWHVGILHPKIPKLVHGLGNKMIEAFYSVVINLHKELQEER